MEFNFKVPEQEVSVIATSEDAARLLAKTMAKLEVTEKQKKFTFYIKETSGTVTASTQENATARVRSKLQLEFVDIARAVEKAPVEAILEAHVAIHTHDENNVSIVRVGLSKLELPAYLKDNATHRRLTRNPLFVDIRQGAGISCWEDSVKLPLKVGAPVSDSFVLESLVKASAFVTNLRKSLKVALEVAYEAPVVEYWDPQKGHLSYTLEFPES